jgi:hypothetical protein
MISVHFANHVSVAMLKHPIKKLDFFFPATVGSMLLVREQEVLAAVENSVRSSSRLDSIHRAATVGRKPGILSCTSQHIAKAKEESRGAACLEDELVREDKHARFRQKVGIDMLGLNHGQDLAVDLVEHQFPSLCRHCFQAILLSSGRESIRCWSEPDL